MNHILMDTDKDSNVSVPTLEENLGLELLNKSLSSYHEQINQQNVSFKTLTYPELLSGRGQHLVKILPKPIPPSDVVIEEVVEDNSLELRDIINNSIKVHYALLRDGVLWKNYVSTLLQNNNSTGINTCPPKTITELKSTEDVFKKAEILSKICGKDMLQPPVQFWDFEIITKIYSNGTPILCPTCKTILEFTSMKTRCGVRMLYGLNRPVLLATSFLKCTSKEKKQHELLGYDPRLLKRYRFLEPSFMLFHKAGVTLELAEFILENIQQGIMVSRIYDSIKQKYEVQHNLNFHFFSTEIENVNLCLKNHGKKVDICEELLSLPYINCHPSKAFINKCFQSIFNERMQINKMKLESIKASNYLFIEEFNEPNFNENDIDFNFDDIPSEYEKELQKTIFIFNESKQIIAWCLLIHDSFTDIKNILIEIKNRFPNIKFKGCFTKYCCKWKAEIEEIFGTPFVVNKSFSSFVKEFAVLISNKQFDYDHCMKEFKEIFHCEKEKNDDVTTFIENNFENFLSKWLDVTDNRGNKLFDVSTLEFFENFKRHLELGCFTHIRYPLIDRNYDDVFQFIKGEIMKSKVSKQYFTSVMLDGICKYNQSESELCQATNENEVVDNGNSTQKNGDQETFVQDIKNKKKKEAKTKNEKLDISAFHITNIVNEHYKAIPMKVPLLISQALMYFKFEEDLSAFASHTDTNLRLIPFYSSALNLISHPNFIVNSSQGLTDDSQGLKVGSQGIKEDSHGLKNELFAGVSQKIRFLDHSSLFNKTLKGEFDDVYIIIAKQLTKNRIQNNLSINPIDYLKTLVFNNVDIYNPDQTKLVLSLKNFCKNNGIECSKNANKYFEEFLQKDKRKCYGGSNIETSHSDVNNILPNKNITNILRNEEVFDVNNILPNKNITNILRNEEVFEKMHIEVSTVQDIETTVLQGVVESNEDSLVARDTTGANNQLTKNTDDNSSKKIKLEHFVSLKRLADKLGAVIVLLTTIEDFWFVPIFPEYYVLSSPNIFIVYEKGKFYAAWLNDLNTINSIRNINLKLKGKPPQCRCGRGKSTNIPQRCGPKKDSKTRYLTRCVCYRLGRSCTDECDCRDCTNPYGLRPERSARRKMKSCHRRRYVHKAVTLLNENEQISEKENNESSNKTEDHDLMLLQPFEHAILEAVVNNSQPFESEDVIQMVAQRYNNIVQEITSIKGLEKVVQERTRNDIERMLSERDSNVAFYLDIYKSVEDKYLTNND